MTGVSILTGGDVGGVEIDLPISGAKYVFLNQSGYSLAQNYIANGVNGIVTGTPVQSSLSTDFTSLSSYLTTSFTETSDMTVFAVVKSTATGVGTATSGYYLGTYGANNKIGAGMWQSGVNGTSISFGAQHGSSSVIAGFAHNNAIPALLCGRCNATTTTLKNFTSGLSATATTATARNVNNAQMRIGGAYKDFAGVAGVYMVVVFDRYLTDGECDTVSTFIKKYYSFDGLAV